jgi:hypothetical protein
VTEKEEERRRLWEKAWPGPVQLLESPVLPDMKDAAQQTEEGWPKSGKVDKRADERVGELVEQHTQVEEMYDADDEDDDEGLVVLRKKSKKKERGD